MTQHAARGGLLWGLGAYTWWGLMPVYFRAVQNVPPGEILAHRIVWCAVLLTLLLTALRRWPEVARGLRSPGTVGRLVVCSLLLAVNWFAYIYGALSGRIMQASLGYFLLPLLNVVLGLTIFGERLRRAQAAAVVLAFAGVLYLIAGAGEVPWIALTIAGSFSVYGVLRKVTPVDGLTGLFIETLLLAPPSAAAIAWWQGAGSGTLGQVDAATDGLLLLSGPVTAVPLLCFGQAARRLPLVTMGLLQYLSPTLQFLLAWLLYGEAFGPEKRVTFGLIWSALAVATADSLLAVRRGRPPAHPVPEPEPLDV